MKGTLYPRENVALRNTLMLANAASEIRATRDKARQRPRGSPNHFAPRIFSERLSAGGADDTTPFRGKRKMAGE